MASQAAHAVGAPVPRVDAREKVAGTASYAADVKLAGVLRAQTLRSPIRTRGSCVSMGPRRRTSLACTRC